MSNVGRFINAINEYNMHVVANEKVLSDVEHITHNNQVGKYITREEGGMGVIVVNTLEDQRSLERIMSHMIKAIAVTADTWTAAEKVMDALLFVILLGSIKVQVRETESSEDTESEDRYHQEVVDKVLGHYDPPIELKSMKFDHIREMLPEYIFSLFKVAVQKGCRTTRDIGLFYGLDDNGASVFVDSLIKKHGWAIEDIIPRKANHE